MAKQLKSTVIDSLPGNSETRGELDCVRRKGSHVNIIFVPSKQLAFHALLLDLEQKFSGSLG